MSSGGAFGDLGCWRRDFSSTMDLGLACAALGVDKRRVEESVLGEGLGSLLGLWKTANVEYVGRLLDTEGVLGPLLAMVHILLLAFLLWRLAALLADRELTVGRGKVLAVVLTALLPTALNAVSILMAGGVIPADDLWRGAFLPAGGDVPGSLPGGAICCSGCGGPRRRRCAWCCGSTSCMPTRCI